MKSMVRKVADFLDLAGLADVVRCLLSQAFHGRRASCCRCFPSEDLDDGASGPDDGPVPDRDVPVGG